MEPAVRLAKLNTEESQPVAMRFGIRSIPTFKLFVNGKVVKDHAGAMSSGQIQQFIAGAV